MNDEYRIDNPDDVYSPALVVFAELVQQNLDQMLALAGDPARLRPHCKTHKVAEVVKLQLALGITKHKCATFAEAEMLAACGVNDILLAYSLVGPNVNRAALFRRRYPHVRLTVTADDLPAAQRLADAVGQSGNDIDVLLDIDSGQHRTGKPMDEAARQLYIDLQQIDGLNVVGLHLYDGQNHQVDVGERRDAVAGIWTAARTMADDLERSGAAVRQFVAGGSGSFPLWAEFDDPRLEVSPGTVVYFDVGYGELFPDLPFRPAALLLTRVVSRPTANRVTFDLGYKAVAGDPPAGKRVSFPRLPDAREVLHNEEHLVVESEHADQLAVGDWLLAIPRHICPCSALHQQVHVVRGGRVAETWQVASRDRQLTV